MYLFAGRCRQHRPLVASTTASDRILMSNMVSFLSHASVQVWACICSWGTADSIALWSRAQQQTIV